MGITKRIATWGSLVKFSHSVFALPFALIMVVEIARYHPISLATVMLLLVCIVAARTAAMGFNRIVDRNIDRANPRTAAREIPSGLVPVREAILLTLASGLVFILGAGLLGWHCLLLSPVVLAILLGYSLMKRYTACAHFVLGLALACAPGGVWYALTGIWSLEPLALMGGVLTWVAGFDILYSCQDYEFDCKQGLFSIPARIGIPASLLVAALLHILALGFLALFGVVFDLGLAYWIGLVLFGILLLSQHIEVKRRGIGCINQVFFTRNALASLVLLAAVVVDSL